jgi:PAS domain S-box-containing protein
MACAAAVPGTIVSFYIGPDGKGALLYASPNFVDVYGFAPEDMRADAIPAYERIHDDDKDRVTAAMHQSVRTGLNFHQEYRYEHPQRGMIWIEMQSRPELCDEGGVLWRGYAQDITERKRTEDSLRANEARYRALFDSNLIGVCCCRRVNGIDGVVTDANDKYLEIIGRHREDLVAGQINWVELAAPEFQHVNQAAIAELLTTGRTQHPVEKEYVRKDGTRAPVLVTCAALDKVAFAGVGFVLDKSEQKKSEAMIRRLHADRIAIVQSMSSEINQPLTATVAYLGAARRLLDVKSRKRQAIVAETLDKASAQVARAGRIVSRLRSFVSRRETDGFRVNADDEFASRPCASRSRKG